jgi:cytochrome c5
MSASVTPEAHGSVSEPRPLVQSKCSRCHDLGRVYAVVGSGGGWVKTVVVMSDKEQGWISAQELESLAACTFEVAGSQPGTELPAPPESLLPPRVVFEEKCSRCHDLGRVYAVINDPVRWVRTVVVMSDKDPDWIFGDSMKTVIRYRQNHPAYVERLFDGSCGTCHSWDELRRMKKTVQQWRTTLNYMARRCGDGLESHEREALYYAIAAL